MEEEGKNKKRLRCRSKNKKKIKKSEKENKKKTKNFIHKPYRKKKKRIKATTSDLTEADQHV